MRFTFLGTGTSQGIPIIGCPCAICASTDSRDKRLRTSALIEHNGTTIVIDAGPDFRQQMLSANVRNLDAILLTHEHRDHIAGLDDVRAYNYLQQKPMDIWGEPRVLEAIQNEFSYVFADYKYPGSPEMNLLPIEGNAIRIGSIEVLPIRAMHYRLPVYGFRIENLTYITDANSIPEREMKKIAGTDILIINALRKEKHISHFTLNEAIKVIEDIAPKQAYITHISHQMGFHSDVQLELPMNIFLAYDGLVIEE
ncbi:MAG: MBL fold metallo-hydrolase [Tenuifilaceae bacterium]|nr:MBL fold metallo-hydrolase [Tenuifilaceae bacterium]